MHKVLVIFFSTFTGLGGFSLTIFLSNFNHISVFVSSFSFELGDFHQLIYLIFFLNFFTKLEGFFTKTE